MAVPLTSEERTEYDATEGRIVAARRQLKQIKGIPHEPFGDFLAAVHHLAANDAGPDGRAANEYLNAFTARREIVATSSAKYEALGRFADAIKNAQGALLFTETVRAANHAIVRLDPHVNIEIITGDTGRRDRAEILDDLRDGTLDAVAAPRVLDEGVDVPNANLGLVVSASRTASCASVVLPEPVAPMMAVVCPRSMRKPTPDNTGRSAPGYRKPAPRNSRVAGVANIVTGSRGATTVGGRSSTSTMRWAATAARGIIDIMKVDITTANKICIR